MGRPEPHNDPDKPILTGPPFYLEEFEQSYRYIINEYRGPTQGYSDIYALCGEKTLQFKPKPPAYPDDHLAGV